MDNRRVFKSYKDRVRKSVQPYEVPKTNILGKVKRLLSPSVYWNKVEGRAGKRDVSHGESKEKDTSVAGGIRGSQSVLHSFSRENTEDVTDSNQILASFFKDKGDKPLSEVEYEGVMSLISKTRSNMNTPNNTLPLKDVNRTVDSSFLGRNNTSMNQSILSRSFAPPSNQHVLKNTAANSSFALSDYKPAYHTFHEGSTTRRIPSIKRVYHFSGLPSPYRTRIRAPSFSDSKRSKLSTSQSTAKEAAPEKPLSNAANSLLSILDSDLQEKTETQKPNIQNFTNPYADNFTAKKQRKAVSSTQDRQKRENKPLTANDIDKTISYFGKDNQEELSSAPKDLAPAPKAEDDTLTKDQKPKLSEKAPSSETNVFSSMPKDTNTKPSTVAQVPLSNVFDFKPKDQSKHNDFLASSNSGSLFSGTNLNNKSSFNTNTLFKPEVKKDEFTFPEVHPVTTSLNHELVHKYESLFDFGKV